MAYGIMFQRKNDKKADINRPGAFNKWSFRERKTIVWEKTFNITYYPAFQNARSIMKKLHILLTSNKEHKKVFPDMLVVGFWNGKSLKDYLVGAKLSKV